MTLFFLLKLSMLHSFFTSNSLLSSFGLENKLMFLIQNLLEHCSVLFQLFRQKEQLITVAQN